MITDEIKRYVAALYDGTAFEDDSEFEGGIVCEDFYKGGRFEGTRCIIEFSWNVGLTIIREEKKDQPIGYHLPIMALNYPHEMTEEEKELYDYCKTFENHNTVVSIGEHFTFTTCNSIIIYYPNDDMLDEIEDEDFFDCDGSIFMTEQEYEDYTR